LRCPSCSPEAAGIVPATVFLIAITFCQLIFAKGSAALAEYTAALSTITFIIFLGFADDVLNLRWRYKVHGRPLLV
jgi:UDP-N-acetylglucosamine--dolichyl-phosphate N-acetylglucosaminephosphotransferase